MKKQKQIIDLETQRYGLFITENSLNLDIAYGRHFLDVDNPQEVIIHKINILETKTHSLYGQSKAKDKSFFPPVRIKVRLSVGDSEQKYYGEGAGGIVRDDVSNLTFGVYLKELEEKHLEIDRGDIVEYNMSGEKNRYYEVESANNVTDETSKTIGGFKPYFKKVICTPIKSDSHPFGDDTKGTFL